MFRVPPYHPLHMPRNNSHVALHHHHGHTGRGGVVVRAWSFA